MGRAAIYARISADRDGEAAGVTRQEVDCRALADRLGHKVAGVFVDNDRSAMRGPRPEFDDLIASVQAGDVDVVLCWATDRLYRRLRDLERIVDVFGSVPVHTVRSGDVDMSTADGRLHARMLGSVAAHEAEKTGERVTRKHAANAAEGRFHGGGRPFGYDQPGRTERGRPSGPLVIVPREAEAARAACLAVASGRSLGMIAREWNAAGLTTPAGGRWDYRSVRRTLTRPAIAGLTVHRGEVVGTASWPPIVDRALWQEVSAILTAPSRLRPGANARVHLLSGLLVCGRCGARMVSAVGTSNGKARQVYRCRAGNYHLTRAARPVEAAVIAKVLDRLTAPDAREALLPASPDNGPVLAEIAALRTRQEALAVDFAEGLITREAMRAGTERLRVLVAKAEDAVVPRQRAKALRPLLEADDPETLWATLPLDSRRAVIDTLVVVTIRPPVRPGAPVTADDLDFAWR